MVNATREQHLSISSSTNTEREKYGKKLKNQDCKERFRDKTKTLEKVDGFVRYLDGYIYRERERSQAGNKSFYKPDRLRQLAVLVHSFPRIIRIQIRINSNLA
jgi:hypothetical protein